MNTITIQNVELPEIRWNSPSAIPATLRRKEDVKAFDRLI